MKSPVTVAINTLNEEANLPGCLESVRWAAEVVLVDMHSTDRTVPIAEEFGCRVFQHEPVGYVEPARNFAIAQASHEWVLVLDADERVSEGLVGWIAQHLATTDAAALRIPRRNYYDETWVTCCGWFPDEQVRLFRKAQVRYSDRIHRAPEIDGTTETLPLHGDAFLKHYAFANLEARVAKSNKYSTIAARAMAAEGKRVSAGKLLARTIHSFVTAYFFQQGIRFGTLGMVLALERAFSTFLKYARLWELAQGDGQ